MKSRMRKGALLTIALLSIGIIGGVFFFPINFDNQYTCLYHRIFAPEHDYHLSNGMANAKAIGGNHREMEIEEMMHSELVAKYVLPYGLIWWISLMVAASAFFWLRRQIHMR